MKKALALLVVVLSLFGCGTPPARHALKDATVRIELVGLGSCSGTIIGPHAILSATHCFNDPASIKINEAPAIVKDREDDGFDHTILVVDLTFAYWADVSDWGLRQGDTVFYWGNPGGELDWYRRGYVVGKDRDEDGKDLAILDVNGFFGDSGAGVFDSSGRVVGVVSLCTFQSGYGVPFKMMGVYPFHFTAQQWAKANP
jgi:hypothetical protein